MGSGGGGQGDSGPLPSPDVSSCFIKGKTSIGRAEPMGQQVLPSLAAYQRSTFSTPPPAPAHPCSPLLTPAPPQRAGEGNADKHRALAETKGRSDSAAAAVNLRRNCRTSAMVRGTSLPSLCSLQMWTDTKKQEAKSSFLL